MNDPQAGSHEASDRKGSLFRLSPEARQQLTDGRASLQRVDPQLPFSVRRKIPEADAALAKLPPAKSEQSK